MFLEIFPHRKLGHSKSWANQCPTFEAQFSERYFFVRMAEKGSKTTLHRGVIISINNILKTIKLTENTGIRKAMAIHWREASDGQEHWLMHWGWLKSDQICTQANMLAVFPYYFQPVAIWTTGVYGKSTDPFLSCLAKKLVDISGDPMERQWLHQHLSLAVVRGNTASILACVQVWSDFSHPQCINQCFCPSLASLQCTAIAFWMSVFSVSFIVFSMFFMLSVKLLCSIVLFPFSAILTDLILFIFHVPNTTVYCKTFL